MKKSLVLFIFGVCLMWSVKATTLYVEGLTGADFAIAVKQIGKLIITGTTIEFYDRQGTLLHSSDISETPVMTFDANAEETDFENLTEDVESLFQAEKRYSVYPNPTSTTIMVDGLTEPTTLRLYSLEGKLIRSAVGTSINVADVPNGNYLLQCENQILRVIKQ